MKSERYAWFVVVVLMLANLSGFIDRLILSLLVPAIRRDLGLSLTEVSYLVGLPFGIFYTLLGIPIARMADRGSRRTVIGIGIALWSVMTALSAFAGSFSRLLLARVGVGVGEAALQAPATSLIADLFPRERIGVAMSVYGMGIFIGSGLAYYIGGWVVGLLSVEQMWTLPLVGEIRPWQSVFLVVGLPGLLIAALMFTVREPERRDRSLGTVPIAGVIAWIQQNRRLALLMSFGFTASATVNYGLAIWLATFLNTTYGIPMSRAGMIQGILTMTLGTVAVLAGGKLVNSYMSRGVVDGPLRVGIIGASGMLVFATLYPLAPTPTLAIAGLAVVNVFAALPWGAAGAAVAELVPANMRTQGAAMFYLMLNLISFTLGPFSVAALTDGVFHDDAAIRYSLAIVNVVFMSLAIVLLRAALPAYRAALLSSATRSPS